jgi:AAA15 family ATPase/GTPase
MRYKAFRIQNFKGIKDTTVNLRGIAGASVFAFVGLNESGKTTVLEAIHSFSPDDATSELLGGETALGVPFKERVPRHVLSDFNGEVSVTATLEATQEDKKHISERLKTEHGITVEPSDIPNEVIFERKQNFRDGDFKANYFTFLTTPLMKSRSQRKLRYPKTTDERTKIRDVFFERTPDIAYFPTFVFDFPELSF